MSAVSPQRNMVEVLDVALHGTGNRTLVGPEITLRLSPGALALLAGPVAVLLTGIAGWVLLTSLGMDTFGHEMVAAGIVSVIGGVAASVPLFMLLGRGAAAIAQASILGIAIRCGTVLMGLFLAMQPAWGLAKMPLVYWAMGYYFPLLTVETAVIGWLSHRAEPVNAGR